MTATLSYVVIGVLVAYLAVLYLPFDIKRKVVYIAVLAVAAWIGVLGLDTGKTETKSHLPYNYREIIQRNPNAKVTFMAAYGMTEAELEAKQPFEDVSPRDTIFLLAFLAFYITPLILFAAKDDEKEEMEKTHKWVFAFCAVALAMLLSLLYGLKLSIVPIYKKAFARGAKSSPALS